MAASQGKIADTAPLIDAVEIVTEKKLRPFFQETSLRRVLSDNKA
jgi:hypothetical protein